MKIEIDNRMNGLKHDVNLQLHVLQILMLFRFHAKKFDVFLKLQKDQQEYKQIMFVK